MLDLAREKGIIFITTERTMFETAGLLYKAGLKS